MPRAIRRFLTMLLTLATALVALLLFILGLGRSDWGGACRQDDDCKPRLVCGVPMGVPYCTQACQPGGPDTCPAEFECARWSPPDPSSGVCRRR